MQGSNTNFNIPQHSTLDFKSLARNILETENAMRELRVTDLSADSVHEEQLFGLSQTLYCSVCRTYGNHNTKYCKYSNYSRNNSQYRQPYQPSGYPNRVSRMIFFLNKPIVALLCPMICPIGIYPGIIR